MVAKKKKKDEQSVAERSINLQQRSSSEYENSFYFIENKDDIQKRKRDYSNF